MTDTCPERSEPHPAEKPEPAVANTGLIAGPCFKLEKQYDDRYRCRLVRRAASKSEKRCRMPDSLRLKSPVAFQHAAHDDGGVNLCPRLRAP
jgi:hypothetical protein